MMSSQSRLLEGARCQLSFACGAHAFHTWSGRALATHFSVNVRCSSQVMMGRFWRSLKVGRITE